jgi:hypothetical protein
MDIPADWIIADEKFEALLNIVLGRYNQPFENALMVGCGTGQEVVLLSRRLSCKAEETTLSGLSSGHRRSRASVAATTLSSGMNPLERRAQRRNCVRERGRIVGDRSTLHSKSLNMLIES